MFIVTIAALVMAASLGWFAYRLLREEQRRSDARVAVLTAALDGDSAYAAGLPRATPVGFAARAAAPAAAAPQVVGPRTPDVVYLESDTQQLRAFRSEAVDDDAPTIDAPLHDALAHQWATTSSPTPSDGPAARTGGLFGEGPDTATGTDLRKFIALGGLVLVSLIAAAYLLFGRPATPAATSTTAPTQALATTGIPLELEALGHERNGNTLLVRGRVKNPVAGSARTSLVASVMLLDQAGGFLGSARTPVDAARLRPGEAASFAVELPVHKDGRRYRVTFRGPDGALVPHVDKR
ncbi:hypothetical protein TBR22_A04840 [Luteitalea sp. TBR-22]|uniref:hypothetical protein n=1 Tax=Luteitalea sp. TBR-22 TaxID=2802971 RepID=UPI001AF03B36|nr:hypothetical protein [Luteitalea sp. TBR-22]BCS31284.1 hypothetical protein TBR22_A04840 [Luteitalea sp. TBR-22]